MIKKRKRGQSTLEYALLIAIIAGALLAMQIYMNRGIQGKLRESTDEMGGQYSAGNVTSKFTTTQTGALTTKEEFGTDGLGVGVSRYEIITPAETDITATGTEAEKITTKLSEEELIEE